VSIKNHSPNQNKGLKNIWGKEDKLSFFFFFYYIPIMSDKKQRFYRLLENYINESRKEEVELMYGTDSKIKVHNWTYNAKGDQFIFELIVVLGGTINESVMDTNLAEVLLEDALQYFYPEVKKICYIVRFDV